MQSVSRNAASIYEGLCAIAHTMEDNIRKPESDGTMLHSLIMGLHDLIAGGINMDIFRPVGTDKMVEHLTIDAIKNMPARNLEHLVYFAYLQHYAKESIPTGTTEPIGGGIAEKEPDYTFLSEQIKLKLSQIENEAEWNVTGNIDKLELDNISQSETGIPVIINNKFSTDSDKFVFISWPTRSPHSTYIRLIQESGYVPFSFGRIGDNLMTVTLAIKAQTTRRDPFNGIRKILSEGAFRRMLSRVLHTYTRGTITRVQWREIIHNAIETSINDIELLETLQFSLKKERTLRDEIIYQIKPLSFLMDKYDFNTFTKVFVESPYNEYLPVIINLMMGSGSVIVRKDMEYDKEIIKHIYTFLKKKNLSKRTPKDVSIIVTNESVNLDLAIIYRPNTEHYDESLVGNTQNIFILDNDLEPDDTLWPVYSRGVTPIEWLDTVNIVNHVLLTKRMKLTDIPTYKMYYRDPKYTLEFAKRISKDVTTISIPSNISFLTITYG